MTSYTGWLHPSLESGRKKKEPTKSDTNFKKIPCLRNICQTPCLSTVCLLFM